MTKATESAERFEQYLKEKWAYRLGDNSFGVLLEVVKDFIKKSYIAGKIDGLESLSKDLESWCRDDSHSLFEKTLSHIRFKTDRFKKEMG